MSAWVTRQHGIPPKKSFFSMPVDELDKINCKLGKVGYKPAALQAQVRFLIR